MTDQALIDPPHHPQNPVKRDQVYFTCKGCAHSAQWQGGVGRCQHPEHEQWPQMAVQQLTGRLTLGSKYPGSSPVDAHFAPDGSPMPVCPTVTDLQVCSLYKEHGRS